MKGYVLAVIVMVASLPCFGQAPAAPIIPAVPPAGIVDAIESFIKASPDNTELGSGTGGFYLPSVKAFDYGADLHVGYSVYKVTSKANNVWSTGISSETIMSQSHGTKEGLCVYESVTLLPKPAGVTPTKIRAILTGSKAFIAAGTLCDQWAPCGAFGLSLPF